MKELIRSEYKIEQICNEIDKFGEVKHKSFFIKKWSGFKAEFEKTYGINNTNVSAQDIIEFMKLYYNSNGNIQNTELKQILNAQLEEQTKTSNLMAYNILIRNCTTNSNYERGTTTTSTSSNRYCSVNSS